VEVNVEAALIHLEQVTDLLKHSFAIQILEAPPNSKPLNILKGFLLSSNPSSQAG